MKSRGESRPKAFATSPPANTPKRQAYILTLWTQGESSTMRGCLEAANGKRRYFASVAQLNALFCELGWVVVQTDGQNSAENHPNAKKEETS